MKNKYSLRDLKTSDSVLSNRVHMKTETLKKELSRKCKFLGITLVGFVPVERWSSPPKELPNMLSPWIPKEFWPQSIYPETKTVIVIGLPVPLPIVETAPSIYYHELYKTINAMLDSKAYEIANFLTEKGHGAIYLPRDAYGDVEILIEKPFAFMGVRLSHPCIHQPLSIYVGIISLTYKDIK